MPKCDKEMIMIKKIKLSGMNIISWVFQMYNVEKLNMHYNQVIEKVGNV